MDGAYEVASRDGGEFEIRDASGRLVPDDPMSEAYLNFLTWNSSQDPVPYPEICPHHGLAFYGDPAHVAGHFQQTASLIHTTVNNDDDPDRHVGAGEGFSVANKHRFFRVEKTVPFQSNPDFEIHDRTERSGFVGADSGVAVAAGTLARLDEELRDDDSDVRKVSSWPVTRCFVYIDVSDFSTMPPGHQLLVINALVDAARNEAYWSPPAARAARDSLLAQMCIGDGYIFVHKDPLQSAFFAAYLANLIEILRARGRLPVDFHFRMGAHSGRVYTFFDPGRGGWNYIGEGINGGQRVLGAVGKEKDDVLFISSQLRDAIAALPKLPKHLPDILANVHNRGRRADKHGNSWRVYEINHSSIMAPFNRSILNGTRSHSSDCETTGLGRTR